MFEEKSFKQNSFSRSLINEAKAGAYYTDTGHCERIGRLLSFPEEEVCCLEPSIGDGSALLAVTKECSKRKLYGVELNRDAYEKIHADDRFYTINADFLNGVKVSNKAFSFCFSNPPYGEDQEKKERLERLFMEKIFNYMTTGGILVYVIPYPVLMDDKFLKPFFARFDVLNVYRFDDSEYEKYHQVAIIAKRRNAIGFMTQWLEVFKPKIEKFEKIPYLPTAEEEIKEKVTVPTSEEDKIVYFTTLVFDQKAAAEELKKSSLYNVVAERGFIKPYSATELGHPAVPLKKDLLYLCAIAGGGQGLTGSAANHDLHLQRGVAKVVVTSEVVDDGRGGKALVESSSTKICLTVIENDGSITVLE